MAWSRAKAAALAALTICVAAAGCTTASGNPSPAIPPRQRAIEDAAAILAAFVPPDGAVRLSSLPDLASELRQVGNAGVGNNSVDDMSLWRVRMAPTDVLAWEVAHLPSRFSTPNKAGSWDSESFGQDPVFYGADWSLAPFSGVLPDRQLHVAALDVQNGQTVIRVDADVTWLDPHPAADLLPAAVAVVTFTAVRGSTSNPPAPPPATITDPAMTRRVAAVLNGLPLQPGFDGIGCFSYSGQKLVLTFSARSGGPALAVATLDLGENCAGVTLTIGSKPKPELVKDGTLAGELERAAGLHWPGYDFG
jgi:hypothetical protein